MIKKTVEVDQLNEEYQLLIELLSSHFLVLNLNITVGSFSYLFKWSNRHDNFIFVNQFDNADCIIFLNRFKLLILNYCTRKSGTDNIWSLLSLY